MTKAEKRVLEAAIAEVQRLHRPGGTPMSKCEGPQCKAVSAILAERQKRKEKTK